ncbi:MAG: hypothetical protein IPQ13_05165 [Holophagaceae bacterium]|nr:hypothetical protein [Holophagaceae bacterium]
MITGAVQQTSAAGIATVGSWTLSTTPGTNTLTATAPGLTGSPVTFTATAVAAIVTVTNATDVVNGDVATPLRLMAAPGPDGISLREALLALNSVPPAFDITFSPSLAGQSIGLKSILPPIVRDGTRILGVPATDGSPGVTLDSAAITECCAVATINIKASHVTISGLRFVNVGLLGSNDAIDVQAEKGATNVAAPLTITDVRIENNVFDNRPIDLRAYAIRLGHTQDPNPPFGTRVERVTITGNTFNHFQNDATTVHLEEGGTSGTLETTTISDNTFIDCRFAVELVIPKGSNNRIAHTLIRGNSFSGPGQPISVGTSPASTNTGNVIDNTLITGNTFTSSEHGALHMTSGYQGAIGSASGSTISNTWFVNNAVTNSHWGVILWGGTDGATGNQISTTVISGNRFTACDRALELAGGLRANGNTVSDTLFQNNIISQGLIGVYIAGGSEGTGNGVDGVRVINNTFYGAQEGGVKVQVDDLATGNSVTGLDILNCIFWAPNAPPDSDFTGDMAPASVSFTLTGQAGYSGLNNNLFGDPLFAAATAGDFHLLSGSPAIDRGTATGAPTTDFACFPRSGAPDLGALEYGSTGNLCTGTVPASHDAKRHGHRPTR